MAQFKRQELPVRFARRLKHIERVDKWVPWIRRKRQTSWQAASILHHLTRQCEYDWSTRKRWSLLLPCFQSPSFYVLLIRSHDVVCLDGPMILCTWCASRAFEVSDLLALILRLLFVGRVGRQLLHTIEIYWIWFDWISLMNRLWQTKVYSALAMAGHGWPQEQIPELVDLHAMHIHSFRELPLGHWLLAKLSLCGLRCSCWDLGVSEKDLKWPLGHCDGKMNEYDDEAWDLGGSRFSDMFFVEAIVWSVETCRIRGGNELWLGQASESTGDLFGTQHTGEGWENDWDSSS